MSNHTPGYQDLAAAIASGRVIVVAGAGVSTACAGLPGWKTACLHALDHAERNGLVNEVGRSSLTHAVEDSYTTEDVLLAASSIQSLLKGEDGSAGEFAAWLYQEFRLTQENVTDTALVGAIRSIAPGFVATTNYDKLLSITSHGAQSVTWEDSTQFLNAIRNDENVGHLHGVFDRPRTVVWGKSDYEKLKVNPGFESLMRVLWMQHTLLFVGCSLDGVADPSFATLMDWGAATFPDVPHKHFVLLRGSEYTEDVARRLLTEKRIQIVPYGSKHSELPVFLQSLSVAAATEDTSRSSSVRLQGQIQLGPLPERTTRSSHSSTVQATQRRSFPTRSRSFAGRRNELNLIHSYFSTDDDTEPKVVAVHGLSGSGKTQLCLEYIRLYQGEYRQTQWVSADDVATVTADLAQIAIECQMPGGSTSDLAGSSMIALQWFEDHAGWLLVYDGASPETINALLPARGDGYVLVTSTNPNWSGISANEISLQGLTREDAIGFLTQRTRQSDSESASRIAESFDDLPLALEQAAAYIQRSRIDLADYERLLKEQRHTLLSARSSFTDYPESVYSALSLNVQSVIDTLPEAFALMAYVSYLLPTGIPRTLVKEAMRNYYLQIGQGFDDLVFNALVSELSDVSLIIADSKVISVHPLVQAFIRDNMPEEYLEGWARYVLGSLADVFPLEVDDSSTWPACELFINHVVHAAEISAYRSWDDEYIEALYSSAGNYLHGRGRDIQAIPLLEEALRASSTRHGQDRPEVALSINNLLNTYEVVGKVDEALSLGARAIRLLTQSQAIQREYGNELGKLLSNVAVIYLNRKRDFRAARSYLHEALAIHLRIHGKEHSTTAIDLNNLGRVEREEAFWARRCGLESRARSSWARAYSYFGDAVRIHRALLDENDYRVAIALFNLGQAANNLTLYDEAAEYFRAAIKINDVLQNGAEGFDQIDALIGLGQTLRALGKPKDAIACFERAHEIGIQTFGADSSVVQSAVEARGEAAFDLAKPFFCQYP